MKPERIHRTLALVTLEIVVKVIISIMVKLTRGKRTDPDAVWVFGVGSNLALYKLPEE